MNLVFSHCGNISQIQNIFRAKLCQPYPTSQCGKTEFYSQSNKTLKKANYIKKLISQNFSKNETRESKLSQFPHCGGAFPHIDF